MDFLKKKKLFMGKGLKKKVKSPSENGLFEEKSCLGVRGLKTKKKVKTPSENEFFEEKSC